MSVSNLLLKFENEILNAMMTARYAVEWGEPVDPELLVVIRGSSEAFAELVEKKGPKPEDDEED